MACVRHHGNRGRRRPREARRMAKYGNLSAAVVCGLALVASACGSVTSKEYAGTYQGTYTRIIVDARISDKDDARSPEFVAVDDNTLGYVLNSTCQLLFA